MTVFNLHIHKKEIKKHLPFSPKWRMSDEQGLQKLAHLLKLKTRKALGINYEFTIQELMQEFDQRRFPKLLKRRILKMFTLFESITYMDLVLSEKREAKILKELEWLIKRLDTRIHRKT